MKKVIILLLCFFLTGCTVVRIDTTNVDNILNVILSKENNLYNRVGKGYKYYIPKGVTYIDTNELNDKLYSNGVYYYQYIDIVSYFHKIENDNKEDESLYYSKKIDGDKNGYLEIKEENDKYHIKFFYNYSIIEAITSKEEINEVIMNASYILSTIQFNDNVIRLSLNDDYFTNKEEQYNEFKKKQEEEHFLTNPDEELEEKEESDEKIKS